MTKMLQEIEAGHRARTDFKTNYSIFQADWDEDSRKVQADLLGTWDRVILSRV